MGLMTPCLIYFGIIADMDSVNWKADDEEFWWSLNLDLKVIYMAVTQARLQMRCKLFLFLFVYLSI